MVDTVYRNGNAYGDQPGGTAFSAGGTQTNLRKLVQQPAQDRRLDDPAAPDAIRDQTSLARRAGGGKVATAQREFVSSDGVFRFTAVVATP